MNKDSRRMNLVRIQFARLDDDLCFCHCDLAAGGGVGVEVSRRAPVNQVAVTIGLTRLHQCQVGLTAALQNVGVSIEFLVFFSFGHQCAHTRSRVKARNSSPARSHALGQRALRSKLNLELSA